MNTYEEVADAVGLEGSARGRYLVYMAARWPDTEAQKSRDGYAIEWAERFKGGYEYAASDRQGQQILDRMATGH